MPRLRRHALALCLLAALAVAGCGGGDGGGKSKPGPSGSRVYAPADLKNFIIRESDLPDGYTSQESKVSGSPESCLSVKASATVASALQQKLTALGFRGCAGGSFLKEVSTGVTKRNRPAGLAILMRDENGASEGLPVLRDALLKSFSSTGTATRFVPHSLPAPELGDEAPRGMTLSGSLGPALGKANFYIYAWRRANVLVWVGSSDVVGDFDQSRTLELARKLDARGAG